MSKQHKKVEQLPLDSLNWMPVAEALRLLHGLLGNPYLAAKDLFAAAAAKRSDKRLPFMRRLIASEVAPDQDRKIVPPADATPVYFGREDSAFFVWRPKFEEIWPALAASAAPHAASSARDDEPTSAPTARTDDKLERRMPGPQPELRWRTALARELIRRSRAGEPEPTAEQMCALVQDKSGKPDIRTVQKEMKKLLS
jgi:hypothetical protein